VHAGWRIIVAGMSEVALPFETEILPFESFQGAGLLAAIAKGTEFVVRPAISPVDGTIEEGVWCQDGRTEKLLGHLDPYARAAVTAARAHGSEPYARVLSNPDLSDGDLAVLPIRLAIGERPTDP
jgi:streptogramin lyase